MHNSLYSVYTEDPTWQGLDGFQRALHSCSLDENSVSIKVAKVFASLSFDESSRLSIGGVKQEYIVFTRET